MKMSLYLVYTCDIWKSNSSMGLYGIFNDVNKLIEHIKILIYNNDVEIDEDNGYHLTINNLKDYVNDVDIITNSINYLFLREIEENELNCEI
jgi:hypothetical protein